MAAEGSRRQGVFVSYSRADVAWLKRLQVHVRPLIRESDVEWWDDTMLDPGSDWRPDLERAINAARIAVLLVSPNFLASDFIASEELPRMLEAAENDGAVIIPVILSPSRFARIPSLSRFQSVNPPDQPLAKLRRWRQDEYLVKVAESIEGVLAAAHPDQPARAKIIQGPEAVVSQRHNRNSIDDP